MKHERHSATTMAAPCAVCGVQPARVMRFCMQCGAQFPDAQLAAASCSDGVTHKSVRKTHTKKKKPTKQKTKKKHDTHVDDAAESSTVSSAETEHANTNTNKPQKLVVPPAATGDEASAIYKRMLAAVRGANRDNDDVVTAFKRDCKLFGEGELAAATFHDRLAMYFGSALMLEHMLLQLVRLLPDARKRKQLVKTHARATATGSSDRTNTAKANGTSKARRASATVGTSSARTNHRQGDRTAHTKQQKRPQSAGDVAIRLTSRISDQQQQQQQRYSADSVSSNSSSSYNSQTPSQTPSQNQTPRSRNPATRLMQHRYADNPMCSICSEAFELQRRRHRCRKCGASVCATCSPARMLLAPEQLGPGRQTDSATSSTAASPTPFDPAHPQRVCTICAPVLESLQRNLNAQFANCHKPNPHTARTRLHLPYAATLERACRNSADIVTNLFCGASDRDRLIPVSILKRAHGLAFLTVLKAGLLVTATVGTGVVIAKLDDTSTWSAPSAIGTAGIGGGLEAGGELIDVVLLLNSQHAVDVFHTTQLNIGGALSVAVGPYGRAADAHAAASRHAVNATNFSYAHSRGLFLGLSLHGAVITSRSEVNRNFYGRQITPAELLSGAVPPPRAAQCLYDALAHAMAGVAQLDALALERERVKAAPKPPCRTCACASFVTKALSKKCKTCSHVHDE